MRDEYTPWRDISSRTMLGMNVPRNGRRFGRLNDAFTHDAAYWGNCGDWYVIASHHRDSDTIDESNFQVLLQRLGGEGDTVAVERANHWAVGWVEYLIVAPENRKALRAAILANCSVVDYPVLDDEHLSNLEYNNFWEYAASELRSFDNWEEVLQDELRNSNSGPGDESAESAIIEAARERLEELQPLYDAHVACPVDPAQIPLFAGVAPAPLPCQWCNNA